VADPTVVAPLLTFSTEALAMAPFFLVFVLFGVVALGIRLAAGSMDRQRIEDYIRERGGRIISISWAPFGKGWVGEPSARLYEVVYYDSDGNQHMATCKTRALGGVYFTDDQVAHRRAQWADRVPDDAAQGKPLLYSIGNSDAGQDEMARLASENARLQAELEHLRRGQ
jgi:hypothetical protein